MEFVFYLKKDKKKFTKPTRTVTMLLDFRFLFYLTKRLGIRSAFVHKPLKNWKKIGKA